MASYFDFETSIFANRCIALMTHSRKCLIPTLMASHAFNDHEIIVNWQFKFLPEPRRPSPGLPGVFYLP